MKIYFRCRGGKFYGWGNVTRLSILANHFYKEGHSIYFIYEGDKYIDEYLKNFSFKKIKLREDINHSEEKKKLNFLSQAKYIFMEMLDIDINLQKFYKNKTTNLIIFDDLLDKYYLSDYVISCQEHNLETIKKIYFYYLKTFKRLI
jgi:spore coat polysaccharide biosynthesis predicted glycosyltransferase SpsG